MRQRPEVSRRRRSEIVLTKVRLLAKQVEPISICNGDDNVKAHITQTAPYLLHSLCYANGCPNL
jgi:hypothetical protein